MHAEAFLVTAVCGGGGNNVLAGFVVLFLAGLYAIAVVTALGRAEDGGELMLLIALLAASIAIGGLFFLYPEGINGDGDFLGRFVLSLVASGMLGIGAAVKLGEQSAGRAIFLALAGDVLIPGGLIVLLFASVGLGTGCLD